MRFVPLFWLSASLVAAVPGLDAGVDIGGLLTVDFNLFPDSVARAECDTCCPITIRTIISKI
jgi:hypothetical protein